MRFFRPEIGWIDTHREFGLGDILAWRSDLVHEVAPIDSWAPRDWNAGDGFWLLAVERIEAYGHSRAVHEAAYAAR